VKNPLIQNMATVINEATQKQIAYLINSDFVSCFTLIHPSVSFFV